MSCYSVISWKSRLPLIPFLLVLAAELCANPDNLPIASQASQTTSFWEQYRWYVLGGGLVLVAHLRLIRVLLVQARRRKLAEEALINSEIRFRTVFENSPSCIAITRLSDGMFLNVNASFEKLTGYKSSEVLRKTSEELKWYSVADQDLFITESLKSAKRVENVFTKINNKYGVTNYALISAVVVPIENVPCVIYIAIDVTMRHKIEDALRESEQRLSEVIDFLPDPTFAINRDGIVIIWNKAIEAMTGVKSADILGKGDYEYALHLYGFRRPMLIDQVFGYDKDAKELYNYITKDEDILFAEVETSMRGKHQFLWCKASPLCDHKGNNIGAIESIRDITERKRASLEVQELKDYLTNIINSMPSIIVGMNRDGIVTEWNTQAEMLTGDPAATAIGKPIQALLPDFSPWIEAVRGRTGQNLPASLEKMLVVKNGERRFYDIMVYPLTAKGVDGSVIRIEDVTEKTRVQDLLIQTEKMMSVGGVAAGMAHEINNPLGIISFTAENIQSRLSSEIPANREAADETGVDLDRLRVYLEKRSIHEFIQIILSASRRAAKIVSNMLRFSRRSESTAQPVQLSEIMERAVEFASNDYDLRKRCYFQDIEIVREYEPGMPCVPVVSVEIEQVFLNLIKNAAQALVENPPERKPRISLRLRTERGYAVAEVEDNGPGMDESVRSRIFEPFFTTKKPGIGTGLGLSVTYMIITQNHTGLIDARSSPDKGALFVIHLPLA